MNCLLLKPSERCSPLHVLLFMTLHLVFHNLDQDYLPPFNADVLFVHLSTFINKIPFMFELIPDKLLTLTLTILMFFSTKF